MYTLSMIFVVLLGAFIARLIPWNSKNSKWINYVIPFSGTYVLAIVLIHILPIIYSTEQLSVTLFVLLGFGFQLWLDRFSQGIEHGHLHIQGQVSRLNVYSVLLALCVHAFIEGIPLGSSILQTELEACTVNVTSHYFWGVLLHKLPAAFTLASFLFVAQSKSLNTWLLIFLFALSTPCGAWIGQLFDLSMQAQNCLLALAAGSLLHIGTTIIFETDSKKGGHKIGIDKILIIIAAILVAYLTH